MSIIPLLLALASQEPRIFAEETGRITSTTSSQMINKSDGYKVTIDLSNNELRFTDGGTILWSAPVGTGTGLRLRSETGEWNFGTPTGTFFVQHKEMNPVWYAPDWYFIENKKDIPAQDSPERKFPGGLGAAAIYIGNELAIHGTDKPELLGQRVSHGCIRISDADARRLFHNVQVGTEVVIVGNSPPYSGDREQQRGRQGGSRSIPSFSQRDFNSVEIMDTPTLIERLDEEAWVAVYDTQLSVWPDIASVLVQRGVKDDLVALRGLLTQAGKYDGNVKKEFSTFLADAYTRGAISTLVAISTLDERYQQQAADAIVTATLRLHSNHDSRISVPWPTQRVLFENLGAEGKKGWLLLRRAEDKYKNRTGE